MSEMLAMSIMSPNEENQSFLTEVLKPIITKELVIKEIERTNSFVIIGFNNSVKIGRAHV